jgi:TIR domain
MPDKRLSGTGPDARREDATLADQYIEQVLEYLEGERPTPPSTEGLSVEDLAAVEGALRILRVHRGSRTAEVAAPSVRSTQPPDIGVAYHSADRGWANWLTYELQQVGYRCWAGALDCAADNSRLAQAHQVIAVLSAHYLAAANSPVAPIVATQVAADKGRFIAVRVDDCEVEGLAPSQWIDLTASTEPMARELLLQKVARGQPASRMVTAGPRYRSPLQLFLQRLGREHETACRMLELCVRSSPAEDRPTAGAAQPSPATYASQPPFAQLWLTRTPASEFVPPLLRTTVGDLLGCDAHEWVFEVAAEMHGLAEVKRKLRNLGEAQRTFSQAQAISAVAQELDRRNRLITECRCRSDGDPDACQMVGSR